MYLIVSSIFRKLLSIILSLIICGCSTLSGFTRFENIERSEITDKNLPNGSRVVLELKDGSRKRITIANVSCNDVSDTGGYRKSKSDIFAITVLSWGDFTSNTSSSNGSEDTVVEVATETGVNVLEVLVA